MKTNVFDTQIKYVWWYWAKISECWSWKYEDFAIKKTLKHHTADNKHSVIALLFTYYVDGTGITIVRFGPSARHIGSYSFIIERRLSREEVYVCEISTHHTSTSEKSKLEFGSPKSIIMWMEPESPIWRVWSRFIFHFIWQHMTVRPAQFYPWKGISQRRGVCENIAHPFLTSLVGD